MTDVKDEALTGAVGGGKKELGKVTPIAYIQPLRTYSTVELSTKQEETYLRMNKKTGACSN